MDWDIQLTEEITNRIREARESDTLGELKPSLLATARKKLEDHPNTANAGLQTALDALRQEMDLYIVWALTPGVASVAALEQVRILVSQRGGAGTDRGLRLSSPLGERETALLKLVPVIDEEDDAQTWSRGTRGDQPNDRRPALRGDAGDSGGEGSQEGSGGAAAVG